MIRQRTLKEIVKTTGVGLPLVVKLRLLFAQPLQTQVLFTVVLT